MQDLSVSFYLTIAPVQISHAILHHPHRSFSTLRKDNGTLVFTIMRHVNLCVVVLLAVQCFFLLGVVLPLAFQVSVFLRDPAPRLLRSLEATLHVPTRAVLANGCASLCRFALTR